MHKNRLSIANEVDAAETCRITILEHESGNPTDKQKTISKDGRSMLKFVTIILPFLDILHLGASKNVVISCY